MNPLKAIIFDMDGTLADTEEIHRQAFNIAFKEFNLPLHWTIPQYRRLLFISGGKERIRYCLRQASSIDYEHERLFEFTDKIHARKSDIYREKLRRGEVVLRPGIKRLMNAATAAGIKLAIATASSGRNVETLLAATLGEQAKSLFCTVVSSDTIEDKKPSPAVYQFCLAELGLEATECIVIEDSRNGHLAAQQAGIQTIITTHHLTIDNDFSGAALVLSHLGEPELPFKLTLGENFGSHFVDLSLIQRLLTQDNK